MAPDSKRHTGAQSRTAAVRVFMLVDRALASPGGLDPATFAKEHPLSRGTVERYVMELIEGGVRLTSGGGVFRYAEGQEPLFTPHAGRLFSR